MYCSADKVLYDVLGILKDNLKKMNILVSMMVINIS
jgi:hypothetical protein